MDETLLRKQVCRAVNQLWMRGMLVGADGLVCAEVHRRRYLVTAPGRRMIDIEPAELICVDIGGENVHGGEGVPPRQWRIHRDVFQSHASAGDKPLGASILCEPPNVMALVGRHHGESGLDLGFAHRVPVLDAGQDMTMHLQHTDTTDTLIRGEGLFVAAVDLATAMNRVERIDAAAAVRLAAGEP
jgi:ribulose-5-phosphate 4-epimerase/fuculose-1-phosphate aldolase